MCTAATYYGKGKCFGRNLDLNRSYGEQVVLTPRNFPLSFRSARPMGGHYAVLGMACLREGYPLYYDGMNERGLAMAGLNFPGCAVYYPYHAGADNVTPFELIPWVLGQCADLEEAKTLLNSLNLLDQAFSPELPLTPLHWMAADGTGAIVIEPTREGLRVCDAPVGVLTNAPPFGEQLEGLDRAGGVPGDLSSTSRFVRAAFFRKNSPAELSREESTAQLFHILNSVAQPRGGGGEQTVYTACCDLDRGIYCYTTYENGRPTAVALAGRELAGRELMTWPLRKKADILWENDYRA